MKDILEKLVNGELDVSEAELLLKSDNILEFDEIAKGIDVGIKEHFST